MIIPAPLCFPVAQAPSFDESSLILFQFSSRRLVIMCPQWLSFSSECNVVVLSCLVQLSAALQLSGAAAVCCSIIGFNSMVRPKQQSLTTAADHPDDSLMALRKGSCLLHGLSC